MMLTRMRIHKEEREITVKKRVGYPRETIGNIRVSWILKETKDAVF
jgi:hypothetical protein